MLSGFEIEKQVAKGNIDIFPFLTNQINPNSYDLRLSPNIAIYTTSPLDPKGDNDVEYFTIDDRFLAEPGVLYLGSTVEYTYTEAFIPQINGKSSNGRLGISVHATAGFGDIGFRGHWTLEISVVHPVYLYHGMRIAQICFFPINGLFTPYDGRYNNESPVPIPQKQKA
jgi:dCTP deaminase